MLYSLKGNKTVPWIIKNPKECSCNLPSTKSAGAYSIWECSRCHSRYELHPEPISIELNRKLWRRKVKT